jgi:hypothetical protein
VELLILHPGGLIDPLTIISRHTIVEERLFICPLQKKEYFIDELDALTSQNGLK